MAIAREVKTQTLGKDGNGVGREVIGYMEEQGREERDTVL